MNVADSLSAPPAPRRAGISQRPCLRGHVLALCFPVALPTKSSWSKQWPGSWVGPVCELIRPRACNACNACNQLYPLAECGDPWLAGHTAGCLAPLAPTNHTHAQCLQTHAHPPPASKGVVSTSACTLVRNGMLLFCSGLRLF